MAGVVESARLGDDLDGLVASVHEWLSGTEPAWRRDVPQASLRGEISLFWHAYDEAVGTHASRLKAKDAERAAAIKSAASGQGILEARAAEVASQLERIRSLDRFETPLGPLPVGLGQLVLAFPVVLGFGFVIAAATFAEAVRLRQAYHRLARQKDPRGAVLDDDQVALVAPLWLEPREALLGRMARLFVLALPALVFAATLALAVQNRLLGVNFPTDAGLGRTAYAVLYVLAAGLFVAGALVVWRALRRYRIEPATVERSLADQPRVAA